MTETIPQMCAQGWILRMAYLKASPFVRARHKVAYEEHLRTCPSCSSHYWSIDDLARRANQPHPAEETHGPV